MTDAGYRSTQLQHTVHAQPLMLPKHFAKTMAVLGTTNKQPANVKVPIKPQHATMFVKAPINQEDHVQDPIKQEDHVQETRSKILQSLRLTVRASDSIASHNHYVVLKVVPLNQDMPAAVARFVAIFPPTQVPHHLLAEGLGVEETHLLVFVNLSVRHQVSVVLADTVSILQMVVPTIAMISLKFVTLENQGALATLFRSVLLMELLITPHKPVSQVPLATVT